MKVTITGRKVNLRDNFKNLATKKLSRFDRVFDAVSYTHLDVYKRQALNRGDIMMLPKGEKIAKILEKHGWIR